MEKPKLIPTTNRFNNEYISDYGNLNQYSNFVGIRYDDQIVRIHIPSLLLDSNGNSIDKKLILNIMNSIRFSKNSNNETNRGYKDFDTKNSFPFYSYIWFWNDYKSNGIPIIYEFSDLINTSGIINWKKTIQRSSIIYKNNVIYNDFINRMKKPYQNIFIEIYKYCIYKSIEMIWFLTNVNKNIIHPIHKKLSKSMIRMYIDYLKNELANTFSDEKRLRINHMISIVESEKNIDSINSIVFGVDKYQYVYEKMIDVLFGNVKNKEYYYPKADFIKKNNEKEELSNDDIESLSKLRPDTINKLNDEILIIDSKYYEFGNIPQTESVAKQVIYGKKVDLLHPNSKIYNVFLIPKNISKSNMFPFEFAGYSVTDWENNKKDYNYVLSYYIDLKYVVENYKYGYNNEKFNLLKADVIKQIKKIKK